METPMRLKIHTAALYAVVLGFASTGAHSTVVSFPDFSSTAGLTLNGSAAGNVSNGIDPNPVLRLTPAQLSQSGSAFSTTTINAATFSTFFNFRITSPGGSIFDCNTESGADGLVFVAQSVSSSIGGGGQGIGYAGIGNSVGVEFDTWCNGGNNDPSSNHIGIDINGNVDHGSGSPNTVNVTPNFDDGLLWSAWVDYDGTDLEVRANQTGIRPSSALLSRTLDLSSILGQATAFVGFTSGTGADWGNHDIVSWEYRDEFDPIGQVPEPTTLALMGLGLAGIGYRRHRSKKAA